MACGEGDAEGVCRRLCAGDHRGFRSATIGSRAMPPDAEACGRSRCTGVAVLWLPSVVGVACKLTCACRWTDGELLGVLLFCSKEQPQCEGMLVSSWSLGGVQQKQAMLHLVLCKLHRNERQVTCAVMIHMLSWTERALKLLPVRRAECAPQV